jgi:hypothetical protein
MVKLRIWVWLFSLLSVWACSPKVSSLNIANRFLQGTNTHILNDSLQLHVTTPADIRYAASTKTIQQGLKQFKLKTVNPVLIYGSTTDPTYQFVVTMGNEVEKSRPNQLILDTTLSGKRLHFLGTAQDQQALNDMRIDLHNIYKGIKTGAAYLQDTGSVMTVVNRAMSSNAFLKNLSEVQQYPLPKNQGNSLALQMQLTFASFLANNPLYERLVAQIESPVKLKDSLINVIKSNTKIGDKVMDSLIAGARLTNVVMVNENHFYPAHRSFVVDLLPKLRAEGYTYLALEALAAPADSLLNLPGGFPVINTGFYTREQTYGNLLRTAKALGYHFVAYENDDSKKDREQGQAENLYRKTLGKDKNAKVLVIAGIDHILEQPSATGKKWMAMVFKERYHINPLTISQTHLNPYRKYSPTAYQLLHNSELKGFANRAPIDYFLLNNKANELSVGHQKVSYVNRFDQPVQVSVFYQKEMKRDRDYHQNVPYYTALVAAGKRIEIPHDKEMPALLVIYDKLGNVLEKKKLR